MYVSTNGDYAVKIEFTDDEILKYAEMLLFVRKPLCLFVKDAIEGCYALLDSIKDD